MKKYERSALWKWMANDNVDDIGKEDVKRNSNLIEDSHLEQFYSAVERRKLIAEWEWARHDSKCWK